MKTSTLTIAEAAAKLGVSRACVYQWLEERRLRVAGRDERGRIVVRDADAVRPPPLNLGRPRKRDSKH